MLHDELVMAGTLELPIPSGDQLQAALAHVAWLIGELAQRGVRMRPFVRAGPTASRSASNIVPEEEQT